jgi:hypothetical protein
MNRKHFEAIARILNSYRIANPAAGFDEGYDAAAKSIALDLAEFLSTQNPNFDRKRFLDAAGIE